MNISNYGVQINDFSMVRRLYVLLAGIGYTGRVWETCHGPEQKPPGLVTRSDTTVTITAKIS